MKTEDVYRELAKTLDSFPQGFPSTESGKEYEVLAYLFSPEEAQIASFLSLVYQPLDDVSEKAGFTKPQSLKLIRSMGKKRLINIRRGENGIEVMLFPFIVGFYEHQVNRMDATFAQLFEDYYHEASHGLLSVEPQFHRVIPINTPIQFGVEILPEENVSTLLSHKNSWAVMDCICRKQQALLGQGCDHPLKMCLVMSDNPNAFDDQPDMEALDLDGALAVLDRAAEAGLVHTISNQKSDIAYVCNCCTCSCALLRGIAEANIANVVARSAYFAQVDQDQCLACGMCEVVCQFGAITISTRAEINQNRCTGCGLCTRACPEEAITLSLREPEDILEVPNSIEDWMEKRGRMRNQA